LIIGDLFKKRAIPDPHNKLQVVELKGLQGVPQGNKVLKLLIIELFSKSRRENEGELRFKVAIFQNL
jgi:hypothetical protein